VSFATWITGTRLAGQGKRDAATPHTRPQAGRRLRALVHHTPQPRLAPKFLDDFLEPASPSSTSRCSTRNCPPSARVNAVPKSTCSCASTLGAPFTSRSKSPARTASSPGRWPIGLAPSLDSFHPATISRDSPPPGHLHSRLTASSDVTSQKWPVATAAAGAVVAALVRPCGGCPSKWNSGTPSGALSQGRNVPAKRLGLFQRPRSISSSNFSSSNRPAPQGSRSRSAHLRLRAFSSPFAFHFTNCEPGRRCRIPRPQPLRATRLGALLNPLPAFCTPQRCRIVGVSNAAVGALPTCNRCPRVQGLASSLLSGAFRAKRADRGRGGIGSPPPSRFLESPLSRLVE